MATSLAGNGSRGDSLLTMEEIKKFFRYFFVGGGFILKAPGEIYKFAKPGVTEEFIAKLLSAGILEEQNSRAQMRYEVAASFRRPVQKLVNENNLNKQLREVFAEFLGR
ncbi:hypothetical protein ACFQI9_39455 [Paraburkholderia dipogonis]